MFHMYDKLFISMTSRALHSSLLSQTVTPSRTTSPSSVTYFMDAPGIQPGRGPPTTQFRKKMVND